jgi:PPM family protein phosphatase
MGNDATKIDRPDSSTTDLPAMEGTTDARRVLVEIHARSNIGLVRKNNEDHFVVSSIRRSMEISQTNLPVEVLPALRDEIGHAIAIADGMGGMSSGEEASRLALVAGLELVRDTAKWNMRFDDPAESSELLEKMKGYFLEVNRRVSSRAASSVRLEGMGTTLIVAYSVGLNLFVVHAGDSRGYLFHGGMLQRITTDHTLAQYLYKAGQVRTEELPTHRYRHILTNYVGNPNGGIDAEIHRLRLADGDRLLLCSDGLSDVVDNDVIEKFVGEATTPLAACEGLIQLALDAGGRDNVTVIVAEYHVEPE